MDSMPLIILLWIIILFFLPSQIRHIIREPRRIIHPDTIIIFSVINVFILQFMEHGYSKVFMYIKAEYYIMTLVYIVLCLIFLKYGFAYGLRSSLAPKNLREFLIKRNILILYVLLVTLIGFVAQFVFAGKSGGIVEFYSQAHGSAGKFTETSAYLHSIPNFLWAMLFVCIYFSWGDAWKPVIFKLIAFIILSALIFHTFSFGNRNGILRLSLMFIFFVTAYNKLTLAKYISVGILGFIAVFLAKAFPHIRDHLHLGSDMTVYQAISDYVIHREDYENKYEKSLDGLELFFNVAAIEALSKSNEYNFGLPFIFPIISFIPRFIWPEKPYLHDFGGNMFDLVNQYTGLGVRTGAALNGIGETFAAFSWFGCLIWYFIGKAAGHVIRETVERPSLFTHANLLALIYASVYWGTQGYVASFYAYFFFICPVYGIKLISLIGNVNKK